MSKNIKTVAASIIGRLVVGVDKAKQTPFFTHTIVDHLKKTKENIKKVFN